MTREVDGGQMVSGILTGLLVWLVRCAALPEPSRPLGTKLASAAQVPGAVSALAVAAVQVRQAVWRGLSVAVPYPEDSGVADGKASEAACGGRGTWGARLLGSRAHGLTHTAAPLATVSVERCHLKVRVVGRN